MKRQLTFRLLVMLLTASLLLSSTGLLTMFAKAEELTTTPTLVTEGSTVGDNIGGQDTTAGKPEITTTKPQTSSPQNGTTTITPESTKAPEPSTTPAADNSAPTVATEGGQLMPSGPQVNAESFVPVGASSQAETWLGVDGTTVNMGKASNPYDVSTVSRFLEIQLMMNSTANADKYFRLTADLDLGAVTIGNFVEVAGFRASLICMSPSLAVSDPTKIFINLDGAGKKILNLNITNNFADTCALFGYLSANSEVYNIEFVNCSQTVTYADAKVSAVVAVQNMGTIRDCSFVGNSGVTTLNMSGTAGPATVTDTYKFYTDHIVRVGNAVFVGDNQGTIKDCRFTNISVSVNKRSFVGGVVGQNSGTITGINGYGLTDYGITGIKVTSLLNDSSAQIGSIAGKNLAGAIVSDCSVNLAGANAVNSFTYGNKVGGVAGVNAGTVLNCYVLGKIKNTQTVTALSYNMLGYGSAFGGITGENSGVVDKCSAENIGMYFGSTQNAVYGGITGTNSGNGTTSGLVKNSYASGKQSDYGFISTGYFLGGIVGSASVGTLLSNCYALVSLSPNAFLAGALIGNGAKANMLSVASPNYWSRTVSGWPTQSALDGSDSNDVLRGVTALNLAQNTQATVNKSSFTHSWGSATVNIVGINSLSAFSESSDNLSINENVASLEVTGGPTAGTFGYINYTILVALPTNVGAMGQPAVEQQMSVVAITTASAPSVTPVVSIDNPIVISNATEILLVRDIPTVNYQLGADIVMPTVSPNNWRTSVFSGTLDGNGKTLTTNIPVFSKIYGSRDATVPFSGGPDSTSNLAHGYVFNLNLVLSADSNAGILGSVIGGTVKNTTLTGSAVGVELTIALNTENDRGGLIDFARGNSYIVGCFTDLGVRIQANASSIGGLIGHINGNKVTVENCGSNADVYSATSQLAVASLIGRITASTGTVKDCFAGGLVQRGGFIAVGNKLATHKLENLYWSIKDTNTANQATVLPADNISASDTVYKWSFDESIGFVSEGESYLNLPLPSAVTRLASAQPVDFTVTVKDSNVIVVGDLVIQGGKLSIEISKDALATLPINTILTVVHNPTGMRSRVTINDGISKDGNGFFQVKTPGDLQYLSARRAIYLADGVNFKIKLMNDIDMYDAENNHQYDYWPIGTYNASDPPLSNPFTGVFDGGGFRISNLVISGTSQVAMFGYVSGATISNLTFNGANITGTTQYIACLAGVVKAGNIHDITVENSTVVNSYNSPNGLSYTGGVVGVYIADAVNPATLNNITIDNLTISVPGGGNVGGVVGKVLNATVAISNVNVTDLDLTGTLELGGVVGSQTGNVTISNVAISASTGNTPQISGTGFVGGIVGKSEANAANAKITGCTVTGISITNSGTVLNAAGGTGGIAGWFSGTVGDDPATTGITESCVVTDCTIEGLSVGGIIGRADTSTGNLNITLKNCIVAGTTSVTALAGETSSVAGGIFGEYSNDGAGIVMLTDCYAHSGVTVNNGRYIGGILGSCTATGATLTITGCQSFAAVSTAFATSYGAAVVGYEACNINKIKIINSVAGGTVSARSVAGGLVGLHSNTDDAFNLLLAGGTAFIANSYVSAIINESAATKAKIVGFFAFVAPSRRAVTINTIAQAVNNVVLSSYPQALTAYSLPTTWANLALTFGDINRPDAANPTFYQHGSADKVHLTKTAPMETVTVINLPKGITSSFLYDETFSWVSANPEILEVLDVTTNVYTEITINGLASNDETGIVAVYKDSSIFNIYPTGTAEKLTFQARIPVFCDDIAFAWIGNGTEGNPFQIRSKVHLEQMRNNILVDENGIEYFGGHYIITDNIAFVPADFIPGGDYYNAGKFFKPITGGDNNLKFVGTLDGKGKTISGLRMKNNVGEFTALFEQSGTQKILNTDFVDEDLSATFKNLTISNAVIEGDALTNKCGGILVAYAQDTTFAGITISDAALSGVTEFAGGIVGNAKNSTIIGSFLNSTYIPVTVSNSSVKTSSLAGIAGGIAGRFGGTIGDPNIGEGFDVTVQSTIVEGGDAGGIVGCNDQLSLEVAYTLVSGGSVESKTNNTIYAAGGILGRAYGAGDFLVEITDTKVDGTAVKAVCVAGGLIGKMAVGKQYGTRLLILDHIESYAKVSATGPSSGTSVAGGIIGIMTDAQIATIANGVAAGSVKGNTKVGGIIGFIEGTIALTGSANNYFVLNFVVSADISSVNAGAKVGLVLGDAADSVLPPTGIGTYPFNGKTPFENIKYSSYQYAPNRPMFGNGNTNTSSTPDFKATIVDLNKGYADNWVAPTYMGLRHFNGDIETLNVILGSAPLTLTTGDILLPKFPGIYGYLPDATNNFVNFTDSSGLNFTLTGVTSVDANKVVTDLISSTVGVNSVTLSKSPVKNGAGELVFGYANGLQLALKVIAYADLEGNGSEAFPFKVKTTEHFDLIRILPTRYYEQVNNITFAAGDFIPGGTYYDANKLWLPLKGSSTYFTGNYNGGGYTISGLKINRPLKDYVGFFDKIAQGGQVYDLTLANATVVGQNFVGALAGEVTGSGNILTEPSISGVHITSSIVSSTSTLGTSGTPTQVGGLVGTSKSVVQQPQNPNIMDCSVVSTTVSTASLNHTYAGGIAASVQKIENCTASNVTVTAGAAAAGIAARTSIATQGLNNPMSIKGCKVNGSSQITATWGINMYAAGILALIDKRIQVTVEDCEVAESVNISCPTGTAGGIMGLLNVATEADVKLTIKNAQSYANVKGSNESGGILGAIKSTGSFALSKVLIKGCVGGGKVESTSADNNLAGVGGIIGLIKEAGSTLLQLNNEFIVECIASAELKAPVTMTKVGKLVGNVGTALVSWTYAAAPNAFKQNFISSYPQDKPVFGNSTMMSDTGKDQIFTDLMLCKKTGGGTEPTFTVQNIINGDPSGDFIPVAVTTYASPPVTTHFVANVKVWNGVGQVELAATHPVSINSYYELEIAGISATTTATVNSSYSGLNLDRRLNIDLTPDKKESGFLEVGLGYGLEVAVPIVTFTISGIGTLGNPFKIENAEHLTLMYYLPNVQYRQMNNIEITPADFAKGIKNNLTDEWDGRGVLYQEYTTDTDVKAYGGFRPIGTQAKPFTGSYDGQQFKITGLYSNNPDLNYVGFFGYVNGAATLKNIHIELRPNGDTTLGGIHGSFYVGGLAGFCSSAVRVENCSVAFGQVSGKSAVGGLIGVSSTALNRCFTNCDVIAVGDTITPYIGEAGGLIGRAVNNSTIPMTVSKSFAAGSVYSGNRHAGGLIGRVNNDDASGIRVVDCFFTGDVKADTAAPTTSIIIGSGGSNTGYADGNRVLVAGTNVSFKGDMSPFSSTGITGSRTYIYYDKSLGITLTDQGTIASDTADLTGTLPAGFLPADWTAVAGSYPRLIMADNYSNAFCAMATIPLNLDAKEFQVGLAVKDGLRFQPSIANTIEGADISFNASKFDETDTNPYPTDIDPDLYGNGLDRRIDLLFKDNKDSQNIEDGTTTIYRNIFKERVYPTSVSLLKQFNVKNSELLYDEKTPVVTLTATIDGTAVFKRIKLPLEKLTNHYYLATERQLRALSNDDRTVNTKFADLAGAVNNSGARVHLTANIDLRGEAFAPIQLFKGIFNGNQFAVQRLRITALAPAEDTGFFKTLEGVNVGQPAEVLNLDMQDVWVTGYNNVGALVGRTTQFSKINNCRVYPSGKVGVDLSLVTGSERVGGMVGWAVGGTIGSSDSQNRSAVSVNGVNSVGGFVGVTTAIIKNSFATGMVTANIGQVTGGVNTFGVGGFAGAVMGGNIDYSFATGNVTVGSVADFVSSRKIGIGGFAGIINTAGVVTISFASGAVRADSVGNLKIDNTGQGSLMFGVGGVAGINENSLSNCYSSSSVFAQFDGIVLGTTGSPVAAGVGGVSGIARFAINDAYSSGSVLRGIALTQTYNSNTYFMDNTATPGIDEKAIGGVIGTIMDLSQLGFSQLYFDLWNNSYGATLNAIGGVADINVVRSLTTDQMCISLADWGTSVSPIGFSRSTWDFNAGAYPSLKALVDPAVSPYIRYPAVLSVVAVIPDNRDISARTGNGITMAIKTPSSLKVSGETYELDWLVADDSEVSFIDISEGTTSKFVPVRTANKSQNLSLIVNIKDNIQYGTRRFDRLCAEMRGTEEKPYLISHKSDLQHIGLSTYAEYQEPGFNNFYNQWYSPLNDSLNNVPGTVHFQLLSDVNMALDVNYTYNSIDDKLEVEVVYQGDGDTSNDNHYIPSLAGVNYNGIAFSDISFAGNDYSINNFTSNREFIWGISENSVIRDVSFENLTINSTGTSEENQGTALVRNNQGTIDGCMIMSGNIQGGDQVAGIVINNLAAGTITNSTVKASITGNANIGSIVAANSGSITNCAFDDGLITVNQVVAGTANAGAIAGSNSGTISNCFSMGSIVSTYSANVIGGLVGHNMATGVIGPAYSRTNVSGGDIIGGFVGINDGAITNAFSAGRVTLPATFSQTAIFSGTNSGTLTDTFADKAMAGKSTHALLNDAVRTENLMDMTCFTTIGTAADVFTKSATETAYPQLTAILALDDLYGSGAYIPQKYQMLIGYSTLSSAAIDTKHSQYIDTLALNAENPVSVIVTPEVSWSTSDPSIITATGQTGSTGGAATLTASLIINASNGKVFTIEMPIDVTSGVGLNPNFTGGDGSTGAPYQISSTASFDALSYYGPDATNHYELTDDINYAGIGPAVPIKEFAGDLNGKQHVVYDFTVINNSGLFGQLNAANITSLGLVGAKTTFVSQPDGYIGLLAGYAQGATITNCYAIGEIEADAAYMGGLVGLAYTGTITGCVTTGKFVNTNTDATAATGGIAGGVDTATLSGCFSTAYVKGNGIVGGIVGEAINTSTIAGFTFAGMVMDTALADGANVPTITTIGNIAGSVDDPLTIDKNTCYYDKQISLIADTNANSKFTAELMTGTSYTVDTGLAGGSAKFAAGVAFATMPIRFLLGSSAGSMRSFSRISLPGSIAGDDISVAEIPQHAEVPLRFHLGVDETGSPILIDLLSNLNLADVYAGLEVKLDTLTVVVFSNMTNSVIRYTEPRLNRIVTVSYTFANPTGTDVLNGETVAVQIKNKHMFGVEPLTYSSDVFNVTNAPAQLEDLVVSSGGIYAGGNLPKGYSYQITATDQDNATLPISTIDGEYGTYIALTNTTTAIKLSYNIVSNTPPWGVYVYWSSLVNALVRP